MASQLSSKTQALLQPSKVAATGGAAASRELPEFMEQQSQTNWCWAANGASVGNFYWGAGSYTQCGIASACRSDDKDCCADPPGCNQYGALDKGLAAAKSYDHMSAGTASLETIQSELDGEQPVGTRVAWDGGGAHFMMITGYDMDRRRITIQDPFFGTSHIAYDSYAGSYHSGGTWTHTYYTQKAV